MLKEVMIKLSDLADAKQFVSLASKCDFDIDMNYGHIYIDAKSIIGVLSLDFRKALRVSFCGENKDFEEFLESHLAERAVA